MHVDNHDMLGWHALLIRKRFTTPKVTSQTKGGRGLEVLLPGGGRGKLIDSHQVIVA